MTIVFTCGEGTLSLLFFVLRLVQLTGRHEEPYRSRADRPYRSMLGWPNRYERAAQPGRRPYRSKRGGPAGTDLVYRRIRNKIPTDQKSQQLIEREGQEGRNVL